MFYTTNKGTIFYYIIHSYLTFILGIKDGEGNHLFFHNIITNIYYTHQILHKYIWNIIPNIYTIILSKIEMVLTAQLKLQNL